mgnify:CR=1 FL=1
MQSGAYELKAELQGFATVTVERLTITIGLALKQDVKMQLQSLQETVTVTGEAPVIEVTKAEVAQVITQQQIDTLPMADRQPASLVLLLPGTNMDNTQVRRSQANIGAGQINNQMNAYFVDGAENRSPNSGQQHAEMPQLAIQEFRVNIAQASAEHGGNVAGLVSTVTKSGTNRFSGEALEFLKDKSLNAITADQLAAGGVKPPYRRYQSGFGIGGPIIKDRMHFFGADRTAQGEEVLHGQQRPAAVRTVALRHVPDQLPPPEAISAASITRSRATRACSCDTGSTGSISTARAAAARTHQTRARIAVAARHQRHRT